MIVLVPSRGRPGRAAAMVESVLSTRSDTAQVILIVDDDDPERDAYLRLDGADDLITVIVMPKRMGYTGSLNAVARDLWDLDTILGAFGDDVLFRTPGWDLMIRAALTTPGIAYGNDLVHAQGHPTAIFMSSLIARTLGYLAIPQSRHLWVDDAWKLLGEKSNTLRYVPDAIFEHMHPAVNKAPDDQTYREVYDEELGHKDHLGFLEWRAKHSERDAALIRQVVRHA